jgi:hypothetical protein
MNSGFEKLILSHTPRPRPHTTNEISPEIQSGTISGKFTGNTTQNRQRQKKTGTYLPATPVEVNSCLNFQ